MYYVGCFVYCWVFYLLLFVLLIVDVKCSLIWIFCLSRCWKIVCWLEDSCLLVNKSFLCCLIVNSNFYFSWNFGGIYVFEKLVLILCVILSYRFVIGWVVLFVGVLVCYKVYVILDFVWIFEFELCDFWFLLGIIDIFILMFVVWGISVFCLMIFC